LKYMPEMFSAKAGVEPVADLISDIDFALEVL
jgi:hypothetical protein